MTWQAAWGRSSLCGVSIVLALLAGPGGLAHGAGPVERVLAGARADVDGNAIREACGGDPRCAAERIATAIGAPARLERIAHPDTDTIRWARTAASLGAVKTLADGRLWIALDRFGRKVEQELRAALAAARPSDIVLDLRANAGGDFGRMLRVAGLLIGPRRAAVILRAGGEAVARDLAAVEIAHRPGHFVVLVGPGTASSAEVLAALLRRHAGAQVLGARTAGKDYLLRVVPVDHDWRLLVPAERIEVPGETLAGGLIPDGPASPAPLAAHKP